MNDLMNPYGREYTWLYENYSPGLNKHLLCFQWLAMQGSEFQVEYDNQRDRDLAFARLKEHFAPDARLPRIDRYLQSERDSLSVSVGVTITPPMVQEILGEVNIRLTPRGASSRQILEQWAGQFTFDPGYHQRAVMKSLAAERRIYAG